MRTFVAIVALLELAACGKHLNAAFCEQNPDDVDCKNAGLTVNDAPAPCTSDMQCAGMPGQTVCDTGKSQCVQCVQGDETTCGAMHCGKDDQCHECVDNSQCAGGVCLPDTLTCLSNDQFRYAAPAPTGSGTACTMLNPCTLAGALMSLDAMHRAIAVAPGDYHEGPLTIDKNAVLIGQGSGGDPSVTKVTLKAGGTGAVITSTAQSVAIDYISVYGGDGDGVTCTSGALTFHQSSSNNNGAHGISSSGGCMLNVDRSQIYTNTVDALFAQSSVLQVENNFMYDNGSGGQDGGAVRLGPATSGTFQFNTVAYNHYKNPSDGGFTCDPGGTVKADFNIFTGDGPKYEYTRGGCEMSTNYVSADASGVAFKHPSPPYDLHLTQNSPNDPAAGMPIRDNSNSVCIGLDIDGDARPYNMFCDLGADEYHP